MTLNLPKSPNPHAVDDVAEGREMASKAIDWLEQLDEALAKPKWGDDRAKAAARNTPVSRQEDDRRLNQPPRRRD
jgi:hypothetical protein